MPRKKNPEKAGIILKTALKAFAEQGFHGCRVETIARKAEVNKQLIYYYFGSKKALYKEVLQVVHAQVESWIEDSPPDPVDNLIYWQRKHAKDPTYLKMLMWEGMESQGRGRLTSEETRRAFYAKSAEKLRSRQGPGGWPEQLKAEQALLSWIMLVIAPFGMPNLVKLISGKKPTDPEYLEEREIFLGRLGEILKTAPTGREIEEVQPITS